MFATLLLALAPVADPVLPPTFSVTCEIASGEPGGPAERVTIRADGKTAELLVGRRLAGNEREQIARVALTRTELTTTWQLIVDRKLRGFLPDEQANGADFGEQRLRIEWTTPNLPRPQRHDVSWTHPLANPEGVTAIQKNLARLAGQRLKDAPLTIFPGR